MKRGGGRLLWGDGSFLYLHCGGGYMTAHMCQNSQNCTLKCMTFTICELYPNKKYFKIEAMSVDKIH